MCGILALYCDEEIDNNTNNRFEKSLNQLFHRGPDSQGISRFDKCILGSTRLMIVDKDNLSNMPMASSQRAVSIIFNGMIYNYKELRKYLSECGCEFRTNSDTEVILNSYIRWGRGFEKYLQGMWAFVIWDDQKKILLASRDRYGLKPLYFKNQSGTRFTFCSEIRAMRGLNDSAKSINSEKVNDYLRSGNLAKNMLDTFYADVNEFPPSHSLILHNDKEEFYKYYEPSVKSFEGTALLMT